MEGFLAIFPKSAVLVQPAKSAFNNPAFGYNYKFMQFITFDNFNFSSAKSFYGKSKIFAGIPSVNDEFLDT
jgi:hypothetical protein